MVPLDLHFCGRWGSDGQGLDLDEAAAIISGASGPSGLNVEYLCNLENFLASLGSGFEDPHIKALGVRVEKLRSTE